MGTNYYRIPTEDEMRERKNELIKKITNIKISPRMILNKFEEKQEDFNSRSVWDEFISDTKIHLGKRSMGWKFVWNFHGNRYYTNKEELFDFIRRGRVINEYGELIDSDGGFPKEVLEELVDSFFSVNDFSIHNTFKTYIEETNFEYEIKFHLIREYFAVSKALSN